MTEPLIQLVNWREVKRVSLIYDEDVAAYERDPELFAMRHVDGRIHNILVDSVDGFTELTIEYQPLALSSCADCQQEGVTEPMRASERLADGTLLCAMHDHYRKMAARGRSLDFSSDPAYWRNWFERMAPDSELAREVLDSDLLPPE